jgi:predicted ester cyclase
MEAVPSRDPALRVSPVALLREPLLLAVAAAFVGAAVGLVGTFRQAAIEVAYDYDPYAALYTATMQAAGEALAALSLLGIPSLLGGGPRTAVRRAAYAGGFLLLLLLAASAISLSYRWTWTTGERPSMGEQPPLTFMVPFWASFFLPAAVVVPFVLAALLRRRWRLGALLAGLCVLAFPFGVVSFLLFPSATYYPSETPVLLGFFGWGVSLPEAPLWALLGVMFFRRARERAYSKAERMEAEENRKRARRLYEEGLGRGDLTVIDELVSEDFRDLRHGGRGKLGMERVLQGLWESFPDLAVRVEGQETEGDLVRTRLSLSGTDRGGGVLWYPPTGRRATFTAEFVDRFSGGELVEHAGSTDTEGLLRQLGHPKENRSPGQ